MKKGKLSFWVTVVLAVVATVLIANLAYQSFELGTKVGKIPDFCADKLEISMNQTEMNLTIIAYDFCFGRDFDKLEEAQVKEKEDGT